MKHLILVLLVSIIALSCNDNKEPSVSYDLIYNCLPIPPEVPDTFASGTPIPWDCEMATFHKTGRLRLIYNKKGGLVIIQKISKDFKRLGDGED